MDEQPVPSQTGRSPAAGSRAAMPDCTRAGRSPRRSSSCAPAPGTCAPGGQKNRSARNIPGQCLRRWRTWDGSTRALGDNLPRGKGNRGIRPHPLPESTSPPSSESACRVAAVPSDSRTTNRGSPARVFLSRAIAPIRSASGSGARKRTGRAWAATTASTRATSAAARRPSLVGEPGGGAQADRDRLAMEVAGRSRPPARSHGRRCGRD